MRSTVFISIFLNLIWAFILNVSPTSSPPLAIFEQYQPQVAPIGEQVAINLDITYTDPESWTHSIYHPSATFIKIHFDTFALRPDDYLTVSNPAGTEIYRYDHQTPSHKSEFWATSISGNTAIIKLHTSSAPITAADSKFGAVIDRYGWGYDLTNLPTSPITPFSTCGSNERTDVVCYEASHPTEFNQVAPVARMVMPEGVGSFTSCTAWRIGPNNHMIANEHCIEDQTQLSAAEFWFNYQRTECGGSEPTNVVKVTGDQLLLVDYPHDFTLFTVNNFETITDFGYLTLDIRPPVLDEEIYIPQHGGGNPKEFGIESSEHSGNVCRIDDESRASPRPDIVVPDTDTAYNCDTTTGSSGSPVIARSSHKVIALHHWGICPNKGVRIDKIWPMIEPQICGNTSPPTLISPTDMLTLTHNVPLLQWGEMITTAQYQLQLDTSETFTGPLVITQTTTAYTVTAPLTDTTYFWRVRGRSSYENCETYSDWSSIHSFIVDTSQPPIDPPPITPAKDWIYLPLIFIS